MLKLISCFFLFFILIQCEWSVGQNLKLKDGFSISELKYENNTRVVVPSARSMVLSPSGILFVACFNFTGLSNPNGTNYPVLAIQFNDNYTVKRVVKVTHELHVANGVAFHNGSLYVALIDRVYRYDDVESHLDNAPLIQSSQIMGPELLPNKTHHGWRYIRFGPDNKLYLAVGAPCNVPGDSLVNCVNDTAQPFFGTIVRMDPDGKNPEIYAKGIRNSVGFDWHPTTKELWFTDNGRDNMDQPDHNLMPPDELNRVTAGGQNFGFPHCYGKNISDVQFPDNCSNYIGAEVELGPHVAAIGMRFYNHSYFPGYKNAVFIAEHGSWNRNPPIGYRLTVVTTVEGNLKYDNFITGWLSDPLKSCETDSDCGETSYCLKSSGAPYCAGFGRPSDVEVLNDGSILISDETRSRIYRVTYSPSNPVPTNWIVWLIAGVAAGLLLIIVIIVISCTLVQPRNNYENV